MKNTVNFSFRIIAGAAALLCASLADAQLNYNVVFDTSSLASSASAPFAVDFQLIGGSPNGNTATLSNFVFGGGSATGSSNLTGGASGSLANSITLTSSSSNFFSEYYQTINPGSIFSFNVSVTTKGNTPTPDALSFSILDKDLNNIPTTGLGNSLMLLNITGGNVASDVQFFTGTGEFSSVAPVPEPSALLGLLGFSVIGGGLLYARRQRA